MTSKSGGGPPLPSHLAFLPPGVALSGSPPPVPRPLAPAPLHPQSDQVYPKTNAPEPIRIQTCGHLGQYSCEASNPQQLAPIVSQLIEAEQRQSTVQFQQQMMFQQLCSQLQQTSQSQMNMMMMRMMMQRPLTVPRDHVGHTENSETVVESLSKRQNDLLFQDWWGTLLLNLLIRYLQSGDLCMNLRVPLTWMVLQWSMTIMVKQSAVFTTKFNRTQLHQFAFELPVNILWKCHIPNFLNCLCPQSLPVSCVVR